MSPRTAKISVALTPLILALIAPRAALAQQAPQGQQPPPEADEPRLDPSEEYDLPAWVEIEIGGLDVSINRAVFYVVVSALLTVGVTLWIVRRMQMYPQGRMQTTLESTYDLMRNNIAGGNMDPRLAAKWFPFIASLFLFIWFNNFIGYIPLPTLTQHTFDFFGVSVPAFAIYAATANISTPLVLAMVVWFAYHIEGIRAHGFGGYFRSWVPAGVTGIMAPIIVVIESLSHFVRMISLSVRLYANILAGHLLILFMGGGLVILLNLGLAASVVLGITSGTLAAVFFIFEIGLVVTLQAFIFATLTAIYIGTATADEH